MINIRTALHRLIGYKIEIVCSRGPAKGNPLDSRCWLSEHGSIRAKWHGQEVILNSDGTVSGLVLDWGATWKIKTKKKDANNVKTPTR